MLHNIVLTLFQRRGPTLYQRCATLKNRRRIFFHFQRRINVISTRIHNVETTSIRRQNFGWDLFSFNVIVFNMMMSVSILLQVNPTKAGVQLVLGWTSEPLTFCRNYSGLFYRKKNIHRISLEGRNLKSSKSENTDSVWLFMVWYVYISWGTLKTVRGKKNTIFHYHGMLKRLMKSAEKTSGCLIFISKSAKDVYVQLWKVTTHFSKEQRFYEGDPTPSPKLYMVKNNQPL